MKKPYASPQIIRVQLNHEQAVLSACSVSAVAINNTGARDVCKRAPASPTCRRGGGSLGVDDAASS